MLLVIHEVDADGRVSLGENEVVRKDVEGVDLVQEGGEVEGGGRLQVTTQCVPRPRRMRAGHAFRRPFCDNWHELPHFRLRMRRAGA